MSRRLILWVIAAVYSDSSVFAEKRSIMSEPAGPVNRRLYSDRMDEIKITGEPSSNGDRCAFLVDRPILPSESAHFGVN
jgi:hypothetical protein